MAHSWKIRAGSEGPAEELVVVSTSSEFGVSDAILEVSDSYLGAHEPASTWIRSISPNATLTPVDDDLHALFLESAGDGLAGREHDRAAGMGRSGGRGL